MTTYKNEKTACEHGNIPDNEVCNLIGNWIQKNLKIDKNLITVSLNSGLTIRELKIDKELTPNQNKKLISKFTELEGKEIEV